VALELTTVSDDGAVLFDGARAIRLDALNPDSDYHHEDVAFRTLPRPGGQRLATLATVNDLHFGETECGVIDGLDLKPVMRADPGAEPYPEVMNRGAVAEITQLSPDAVVAKGDLTSASTAAEFDAFVGHYGVFGPRLRWVRGNHDTGLPTVAPQAVVLDGVILAIVDTAVPGLPSGRLPPAQLAWLDQLGADADRPVLVFGHHHCWKPGSRARPDAYFGLHPDDSERLVEVVVRRPALVGYFAGHTHRNRVRRFAQTGQFPWVEVACVKDFPGTWAEYRVFEGGVLQINHRIATDDALAWSERCRAMVSGYYPMYAFGRLADRCFAIWPRR